MKYFNLGNNKIKHIFFALASVLLILAVSLLISKSNSSAMHTTQGFYFDTITQISIYDSISDSKSEAIFSHINEMMAHYENIFSRTKEGSDIYNINNSNGDEILIDNETGVLLQYALGIAKESNGIVDPTIGALSILWNIGGLDSDTIPSAADIEKALSTVGYENISLIKADSSYKVKLLNPDTKIDLGFVAKGYIADRIKEYLVSQNIQSAIINLGGNVLTIGAKPGENSFSIGIKNPDNTAGHVVNVKDQSVVSSGDYERFIEIDGQRYHHILSTQTGYPAESDLHQVTVISDSSLDGDALSTLCFILGKEKAAEFIRQNYPDIQLII